MGLKEQCEQIVVSPFVTKMQRHVAKLFLQFGDIEKVAKDLSRPKSWVKNRIIAATNRAKRGERKASDGDFPFILEEKLFEAGVPDSMISRVSNSIVRAGIHTKRAFVAVQSFVSIKGISPDFIPALEKVQFGFREDLLEEKIFSLTAIIEEQNKEIDDLEWEGRRSANLASSIDKRTIRDLQKRIETEINLRERIINGLRTRGIRINLLEEPDPEKPKTRAEKCQLILKSSVTTPREKEIAKEILSGSSFEQTAINLGISYGRVAQAFSGSIEKAMNYSKQDLSKGYFLFYQGLLNIGATTGMAVRTANRLVGAGLWTKEDLTKRTEFLDIDQIGPAAEALLQELKKKWIADASRT